MTALDFKDNLKNNSLYGLLWVIMINEWPVTTIDKLLEFGFSLVQFNALFSYLSTLLSLSPSKINYFISSDKSLHEYPIFMAVSILSPVNTHTLIPASFKS